MKTIFIGLLVVGFTSLSFSQKNGGIEEVKLSAVDVTPLNVEYLNKVQDKTTPERVRTLENKVARFDIRDSSEYDKKFIEYEVTFRETDGSIRSTFDKNGKLISSSERFNNVLLPAQVRDAVLNEYPGWSIHGDTYLVYYYHNSDVKKVFKVLIKKDGKRKNLKLDHSGSIIK